MYEEVYGKIIKYLEKNPGVFKTIVDDNDTPTYYQIDIYNNTIWISTPTDCPQPTSKLGPIYKKEFDKIYPLFLQYLEDGDKISLRNNTSKISFNRVYWIGLFFELKNRGII